MSSAKQGPQPPSRGAAGQDTADFDCSLRTDRTQAHCRATAFLAGGDLRSCNANKLARRKGAGS